MSRQAISKKSDGTLANLADLSFEDKAQTLWATFIESVKPPERLDMDEWADKYYVLPKGTSSEYGKWRTSRFPFLRRIMKCLSPSSIAQSIPVIKAAQLGFTETAKIWVLYTADMDPGPLMYVQKTQDAAEDFVDNKLNPTIEAVEKVSESLGPKKPKHLSNKWDNKGFPGGFAIFGGANSGAFLRSHSIGKAVTDEEDSYKASIDQEGSPVWMIAKRMVNFPFRKFLRISTPKYKETSTIEPAFEEGSQERYYLPCPECNPTTHPDGTWFWLKWVNIYFPKDDKGNAIVNPQTGLPDECGYICERCGTIIPEHKKTWMLEHGKWMSEKGNGEGDKPYEVGDIKNPSFHISSLYSPLGFFSWMDAIAEYLQYKNTGDRAKLQVWINQTLGESYTTVGQDVSHNLLQGRKEDYNAPVPEGVLVLTAGVDVQGNRLEVEILGHGLRQETWSIDYVVFMGDPEKLGDRRGLDENGLPTVWRQLDDYLLGGTWKHELGHEMRVECTGVDNNYKTEVVNRYCYPRQANNIFPIRGRDGWGNGLISRPKRPDEKYKTYRYTFWVDEIKETVYSLFKITKPGMGYQHFPNKAHYDDAHFKALTAENIEVKQVKGTPTRYWNCPAGIRNEQLDCRVYAMGAFYIYNPNMERRAQNQKKTQQQPKKNTTTHPRRRKGPGIKKTIARGFS